MNEDPCPTWKDTGVYKLPVWAYSSSIGRLLAKKSGSDVDSISDAAEDFEDDIAGDDDDSEPGKATPSTDSNEEFELLEKSTDSLGQAKASGHQPAGSKSKKRKGKKK